MLPRAGWLAAHRGGAWPGRSADAVQDAAADRCLDARRNRMDLHNSIPIRGWAFKLFAPAKVLAVVNA